MTIPKHLGCVRGDALAVTLEYPRSNDIKAVEISLCDVRASDVLRIVYDFDRDGWSIQQPTKHSWEADEPTDFGWTEVAFVRPWLVEP